MNGPVLPGSNSATTSIGFGCAYLAGRFEAAKSIRLVHAAYDAGVRHFDVAPLYGLGMAENVLGQSLAGKREAVTIATKAGIARPSCGPIKSIARAITSPTRQAMRSILASSRGTPHVGRTIPNRDFSPAAISASLDDSLSRLQTDYIDLFLLHEAQLDDITDELLTMLEKRRRLGAFRALGIASSPDSIVKIFAKHASVFDVHQYSWSVLDWRQDLSIRGSFAITHRAILRAYAPIRRWLSVDAPARQRLEAATEHNLRSEGILPKFLIGAALAANPDGLVLVASHRVDRIIENWNVASDQRILIAAKCFAAALALEPNCPSPLQN